MSDGLGERLPAWFRMSATYYMDDKITQVSLPAELVFVRLLALAHQLRSDGVIRAAQLQWIMHKVRGYRQVIDELATSTLLDLDTSSGDVTIRQWGKWNGRGANGSVSAGRGDGGGSSPRARTRAHARARVGEEEIRREVEERTPSGFVRSSTAAAPRAGGAAAQPRDKSEKDFPPEVVQDQEPTATLDPDVARATIRAAIQKAQSETPGSTGRNTLLGRPEWQRHKERKEAEAAGKYESDPESMKSLLLSMFPPPPQGTVGETDE